MAASDGIIRGPALMLDTLTFIKSTDAKLCTALFAGCSGIITILHPLPPAPAIQTTSRQKQLFSNTLFYVVGWWMDWIKGS